MSPIEPRTQNGIRKNLLPYVKSAHAGLWLDRFLKVLHPDSDEDKEAIRKLFDQVASGAVPEGYAAAYSAHQEQLKGLSGGIEGGSTHFWEAEVQGRMVIGLGNEALTETSITLEHTWGVPMIPGSALKGLAAATAHRYGGHSWKQATNDHEEGGDARLMFGNTESAGFVVFHDAWWKPKGSQPLPLDLDIMTVHHSKYYGDAKTPPADTDEPNPVSFLTAHGSYLVALSGPRNWVERAAEWLEMGLREEGIGGKTSAGYGRLILAEIIDPKEKECGSILHNLEAQHRGASTANDLIRRIRKARNIGCDPTTIERAGRALYDKDPGFWKNWLKNMSDENREELRSLGLYEVKVEPSPDRTSRVRPLTPAEGIAWATSKKDKVTVHVEISPGQVLKRRIDKIDQLDSITRKALEERDSKTDAVPVVCEFSVEGPQKTLKSVKLK